MSLPGTCLIKREGKSFFFFAYCTLELMRAFFFPRAQNAGAGKSSVLICFPREKAVIFSPDR